jgi:hypothetical protein
MNSSKSLNLRSGPRFASAFAIALVAVALAPACGEDSTFGTGSNVFLEVSPISANFDEVVVDPLNPQAIEITVANKSLKRVDGIDLRISAGEGDFTLDGNQCTGTLAPNQACKAQVLFTPKTPGGHNGTVSIKSDDTEPQTVSLRGQAEADAGLLIVPTFQDFGKVDLNADSVPFTFEVTNGSQRRSGALTAALEGADAASFAVLSNNCSAPLEPGATCAISVLLRPTTPGLKQAAINVTDTVSLVSLKATLSGIGRAMGSLSITPATFAFGELAIGTERSQVFTVKNTGLEPTPALSASVLGDTYTSYSIGASTCLGAVLQPAASCNVSVSFLPTSVGDRNGTLLVSGQAGLQISAELTGKGIPVGNLLELSAGAHDFGDIAVGGHSSFLLTLSNIGTVNSGIPDFKIVGRDANEFTVTPSQACTTALSPGATCLVTVDFSPVSAVDKEAALIITAAPGGQLTADLSGKGSDPLALTPSSKDFGDVRINVASAPEEVFVLRNNGMVATGEIEVLTTGSTDFEISGNTCVTDDKGISLAPNAECRVIVLFRPTTLGNKNFSLNFSATPGGNLSASLSGKGVPAGLVVDPADYDFGNVNVDQNSTNGPTYAFSIFNDSSAETGVLQTSLNPIGFDDFTIVNGSDTCNGKKLGAQEYCNITVRFDPTASGSRTATIEINSGMGGRTKIPVRGNGIAASGLVIEPSRYNFGELLLGEYTTQTFTIVNRGTTTLSNLNVYLGTGSGSYFFNGDNCPSSLAAGASCTASVRFGSTTSGTGERIRDLIAEVSNASVPDAICSMRGRVR